MCVEGRREMDDHRATAAVTNYVNSKWCTPSYVSIHPSIHPFRPFSLPGESRQEAEDTPKTMSFMHLHLGLEGALPPGTDVSKVDTPLSTK